MKMRNRSRLLRCLAVPLLAAALFCSCTEELSSEAVPGGGGGKVGESEVTLKLQVPGAATGKTRAITADAEKKVDDLYILAFKVDPDTGNETFEYYVAAKRLTATDGNGQSTWTASLKVKEYDQTFVMVANAQNTNSGVNVQIDNLVKEGSSKVGLEKMEVLEGLAEKLSADEIKKGFNATSHALTMYGQTQPVKIGLDKAVTLTVALHRIVARVQVKFDGNAADAAKFSAQEVYLYNFNDRARVIPGFLEETTDTDYEQVATIPADAELYPQTQDGSETVPTYTVTNNAVENTIYMFEAAQPQLATDAENHLKRPCLIVKGVYEGKSCYYRVDFAKQDAGGNVAYMDIIRNHSYNITVTNVSGRGSNSAHEALKNKAANITADVIEWNDNTVGNIEFEGDKVLGIATKEYELMKAGGVRLQQVRATANLEWTAKLYDVNADGTANTNSQPDWINFTDKDGNAQGGGKSVTQQGTNALQDVYFKVDINNARPERKAIMRFTAGTLSMDALVVQNQKEIPVYLNVKSTALEATEIEFMQAGGEVLTDIEFGPEDVTLSWEIVNGTNDGMDFNDVQMDGTDVATDNMKGEITYDGNTPTHYLQVEVNELQSTKAWETRNAKLQLIAQQKSTGEMVVREIPLFQKKYGLEIDKAEFVCGGQEVRIYVRGNMPWNASWSGKGFDAAVAAGLIPGSNDAGSGRPSETSWSSYISVQTRAKPLLSKDSYEMDLTFTHRNYSSTQLAPMQVSIKGGAIEFEGKLYEVYGPVERSYNTKHEPYTDDGGATIQGATIMSYWQALRLDYAEPNLTWGICEDSEVVHEFAISNVSGILYKSGSYNQDFETYIPLYQRGRYAFIERIRMTYAGEGDDKELARQNLLYLEDWGHDPGHTHIYVTGTQAGTGNLLFDITGLGYTVKNQYGNPEFRYSNRNVKWEYIEGDVTNAGIPLQVYGNAWSTYFKPKINNSYVHNNSYRLNVERSGATGKLDAAPHRDKKYQTYYFKLIE